MAGHGAPEAETFDASDLRVAVVAASWHTRVMDGLIAGAGRACADFGAQAHTVRVPGHVRAAGGRRRARGAAVRRRGRARRGGPRRHPALRVRLLGRHRRADPGGARPRRRRRLRRAHLRQRRSRRWTAPGSRGRRRTRATRPPRPRCSPPGPCGSSRTPRRRLVPVKTFDELWAELSEKARTRPEGSGTVRQLDAGVHASARSWSRRPPSPGWPPSTRARERAAEEISQLLYHAQVLMLASGIELDDVYAHL